MSPETSDTSDPTLLPRIYLAGIAHATAYGISFLLPLRIGEIGGDEAYVGQILFVGMVSALAIGFLAGHIADRFGRILPVVATGLAQAAALGGALLLDAPTPIGLLIGVGLGLGWSVFYLLMPLFLVARGPSSDRVRRLTTLSGLMMFGIGLGPISARLMLSHGFDITHVFWLAIGFSLVSAALSLSLLPAERSRGNEDWGGSARLTISSVRAVLATPAVTPILMIALGGSIFGCLTNYQVAIATAKGVDFSIFFVAFVLTVVISRVGFAGWISDKSPYPLLCGLLLPMCCALVLYAFLPLTDVTYTLTTILFGSGYGLAYSVLNGIVANIEETEWLQAALLVFPLAYFAGLYGFPFIGGWLIVTAGVDTLLVVLLCLGLLELLLAVFGLWGRGGVLQHIARTRSGP